ncbi:3-hydroxyanthranilate 3,4-dioxygenase [Cyanidioschyzon merolae strain 10D]|jgi:3-hydroxyanthranilate 3,4-dioxygenase|uniref:3-hydroxyanthranilate 3,4-dioxygenase n=1 Tax=Cyanidioschyzon merolae (strain NIES-3377 / 10D) TaxID=280699 RepID=M1UPW4_CYAM1|nr:3-hydroxyanthranilate 3,4-dioxygenase [Cyanidioschyzon merolae strain 10D]BAM79511.1 3-hydroxyanthranilate 3,4-dioxygenase [Cyanidioschyzon merolae strain 10D]|eukprot:XP_005535797.1 3-hydroxyanthranilate 3,4-dioxygenase [Cyanidioschyzon merolae strain 10D]
MNDASAEESCTRLSPIHLEAWIKKNRDLLRPPVGNVVLADGGFLVMLVGGPNVRTDYHIENYEEIFYQIEGDISLKIVDEHQSPPAFKEVRIREGELFVLPARVPHSPQRPAGTVGLVIERKRAADDLDILRWYCQSCSAVLHSSEFHCKDIGKDLVPIIREYFADRCLRTCRHCGWIEPAPTEQR